jgi:hypothetical protein
MRHVYRGDQRPIRSLLLPDHGLLSHNPKRAARLSIAAGLKARIEQSRHVEIGPIMTWPDITLGRVENRGDDEASGPNAAALLASELLVRGSYPIKETNAKEKLSQKSERRDRDGVTGWQVGGESRAHLLTLPGAAGAQARFKNRAISRPQPGFDEIACYEILNHTATRYGSAG